VQGFMRWMERLAQQRHMRAIGRGVTATLPIIILGSYASASVALLQTLVTLGLIPVDVGLAYSRRLAVAPNLSMAAMGLALSFSVAYYLARGYGMKESKAGFSSAVAYLMLILITIGISKGFAADYAVLLSGSPAVAIIVALVSVEVQRLWEREGWKGIGF